MKGNTGEVYENTDQPFEFLLKLAKYTYTSQNGLHVIFGVSSQQLTKYLSKPKVLFKI